MPDIHPTAIVSSRARLEEGVQIGAFCIIGDEVALGHGTVVGPHTVIQGPATIGRNNRFAGQAAIGTNPQDLKYQGERTVLLMGDDNTIREFVTINRGTPGGGGKTTVGNGSLLMTGVHIAHDCHVGDVVIMANAATLAGHVEVGDHATVGAFVGVHQFCRVGTHAFVGGYSVLTREALPFIKTVGDRKNAKTYGINSIGLERKGFSPERVEALKSAYRTLFLRGLKLKEAVDSIRCREITEDVALLLDFIEKSERGFIR
jgi:UDP-N-acetylglucosamine acyltransferase